MNSTKYWLGRSKWTRARHKVPPHSDCTQSRFHRPHLYLTTASPMLHGGALTYLYYKSTTLTGSAIGSSKWTRLRVSGVSEAQRSATASPLSLCQHQPQNAVGSSGCQRLISHKSFVILNFCGYPLLLRIATAPRQQA